MRADKEREATDGHDGTWVAHPGLVPVALEAFDRLMPGANQIATKKREDVHTTAADLRRLRARRARSPSAACASTSASASSTSGRGSRGSGCVPIFNLMEDAATAEISRSQVWQWIRSPKGKLDDGRKVTKEMVAAMIPEELAKVRELLGAAYATGRYDEAATIFADLVANDSFVEFLTLPAYERID